MNILDKIATYKIEEVKKAKEEISLAELLKLIENQEPPRGFMNALQQKIKSGQFGLIAEIKKASPSKGVIREDFNPAQHAKDYQKGGATCLSVLTDIPSFQGSPEYLISAKQETALPILRKDFMLDPYQAFEARAWGADCILLIMAMLNNKQAQEIEQAAIELNMDVIAEVHDKNEAERVIKNLQTKVIGINNRNLKTFQTSLQTTYDIAEEIPDSYLCISESGINSYKDLKKISRVNVNAFLIGESLMCKGDIIVATKKMLGTQ